MPFHFPLQALLHLRQSIEHQQELRLRAANQQVTRARHLIEQLDHRSLQLQRRRAQEVATGSSGAELRFALSCETAIRQQRQALHNELLRLQKLRDEHQQLFQQARRERETFESLRDHQLRAYQQNAARHEQRQLDDLFLMRQAYLRRS